MKRKTRRFTLGMAVLGLAILLLVSFTIAYLTDQRKTLNVLGINTDQDDPNPTPSVKIKLTEAGFAADPLTTTEVMNPGETDEYAKVTLVNILPGQKINKDPTVTNIGTDKVFVRVALLDKDDDPLDLDAGQVEILDASVDTTKWTYKSGYWYYTNGTANCVALDVNASVPVLVSKTLGGVTYTMMIPEDTDNEDIEPYTGILNFQVVAQAVQSREFVPDMTKTNPWTYSDGTEFPIIPAVRS